MRKILLPLLAVLILTACQKETTTNKLQEETATTVAAKAPSSKINICHYDATKNTWKQMSINPTSWASHQAHGDVRLDDQDGDGYVPTNNCGYGQMGDCDDNNAAINPGTAEICANGIDDNCNGQIDENCYCTIRGNATVYIANVTIGSINNSTGIDAYGDYTALSTNLAAGSTPTISLSGSNFGPLNYWQVYIDYNQDFDFNDAGEKVLEIAAIGTTSTFTVPTTAKNGSTRMRIVMKYGAGYYGSPCQIGDPDQSEAEDYTVNITGGL